MKKLFLLAAAVCGLILALAGSASANGLLGGAFRANFHGIVVQPSFNVRAFHTRADLCDVPGDPALDVRAFRSRASTCDPGVAAAPAFGVRDIRFRESTRVFDRRFDPRFSPFAVTHRVSPFVVVGPRFSPFAVGHRSVHPFSNHASPFGNRSAGNHHHAH